VTRTQSIALGLLVALAVSSAACSRDDEGGGPPAGAASTPTGVLATLADEVIVPSYDALVASLDSLGDDLDALCRAPSAAALEAARAGWRDVATAWRATRASGVGPAMDHRFTAAVGFLARADAIDELLAGTAPVDVAGLDAAGAAVKGISALEIGLFGPGSEPLADPGDPRRCTYLASVAALATEAATDVRDAWTGGYRDTFVAGMDGDPQSSVDALVNELIFRVSELDDQGLRALVEASSPDELTANRSDGPAAFHLAELRATLAGAAALLGEDVDAGRLLALLATRSDDTVTRLRDAAASAVERVDGLPDAVTEAMGDPAAVTRAHEAVAALKVLLATEVASELGVTISFSDADGDS
jgi:predicted lipoprotein